MQIGSGFCLGDKVKAKSLIQTPSKLQNNRLKQTNKQDQTAAKLFDGRNLDLDFKFGKLR